MGSGTEGTLDGEVIRLRTDYQRLRQRSNLFPPAGGLVVKEMLRLSREDAEPHRQRIEQCTKGILFLGTPHYGANLAVLRTLGYCSNINRGFESVVRRREDEGSKIHVTCFYEQLPIRNIGEVVSRASAILPRYSSYAIHANHINMARFRYRKDQGYKFMYGEIHRWVKNTRAATQPLREQTEPIMWDTRQIVALMPCEDFMPSAGGAERPYSFSERV
ncbi:hypothetical protein AJ80_02716 [Polytolypa hystricis UAMH7299]|uniref:Uncharacterized protein n=1 Tax=Polytolypa hystricis (strain UAMH7299) TaxID=1447883 RepID=A0A2B7YNF9_POLH7|nr:hypothetical protein AJ80_02716 [Polytolypa hystricis UAMH7299]